MNLKPTRDNVALRLAPKEKTSAGGLAIVEKQDVQFDRGFVVAVGPGEKINGEVFPPTVVIGDEVFFQRGASRTVQHEGESLEVVRERDIFAVIEN